MKIKINDLEEIYEKDLVPNVKNKKLLYEFHKKKLSYYYEIITMFENNTYNAGSYHIFIVTKPKTRVIMNQNVMHKLINHYICKYILKPNLTKYLIDANCATRKNMGTSYAIKRVKKQIENFKKYDEFYFLKIDIKKFFYSIDHNVLKKSLINKLSYEDYNVVSTLIDSTNREYVNKKIKKLRDKTKEDLPFYNYEKGLNIGSNSSQFLAIFYLYELHHFIVHNLKIKNFTVYMDDFLLIHEDKEYLKYALEEIKKILKDKYKLDVNEKKTHITKASLGVVFLGHKFVVRNKKTIVKLCKATKVKIKKQIREKYYLFKNEKITFDQFFASIQNYKHSYIFINKHEMKLLIDKAMKK